MADKQVFNDENDLPKFLESVLDKVEYVFQSDFDLEVAESHAEVLDQSIRLITSISECADVKTHEKINLKSAHLPPFSFTTGVLSLLNNGIAIRSQAMVKNETTA